MRDYYFLDIAVDTHVGRVMARLGLVSKDASDLLVIYAAREAHPEYPGIFDLTLWRIGTQYCSEGAPRCGDCPLAEWCAFAQRKQ
jgi:endonuclease III